MFLATQSDPAMIKSIVDAVTIPVMAKVRIGHFVEAQASRELQRRDVFTRVLIMVFPLSCTALVL